MKWLLSCKTPGSHHRDLQFLLPVMLCTWSVLAGMTVYAQDPPRPDEASGPTFKLQAVETRFLPPAMYGTWSITATVLSSSAPAWFFNPDAHELWSLDRTDTGVTLRNITNNASATVHVDAVEGNTATFHHLARVPSRRMEILETPTVTVNGNQLSGVNRQTITVYNRKGEPTARYHLLIQVEGQRLTEGQVTYGNPDAPPPEFEVAPLQYSDD